jgi:hypothetical protein
VSTELTISQQVEKALSFVETRAQVIALVEESTHITAITNAAGYQQCHAARMSLKNTRIAIQKTGKEARDDAVKFQKAVIGKEKELVDLIEPEEKRLAELQDEVDKAKEREKAAKEQAEREAQEAIRARFDAIHAVPLAAVGLSADGIRELIARTEQVDGEFTTDLNTSAFKFERSVAVAALKAALDRQLTADAEAEKIKADRAELDRLRAEADAMRAEAERLAQTERDRAAKEERLREQAIAETARVREQAAREAREAEQARIDAERAETRKREDAERAKAAKKLAEEQAKAAAERVKLEADKKAQAKAARDAVIANASLQSAASEALILLRELGQSEHLVTLKLASALKREPKKEAA